MTRLGLISHVRSLCKRTQSHEARRARKAFDHALISSRLHSFKCESGKVQSNSGDRIGGEPLQLRQRPGDGLIDRCSPWPSLHLLLAILTNYRISLDARPCRMAEIGKGGCGALSEPCRPTPLLISDSRPSAGCPEHHIISFSLNMADPEAQIAIVSKTATGHIVPY